MIVHGLLAIAASLILVWLAFLITLAITKPANATLRETARIVPDTIRLVRRLAADESLDRAVRRRLALLLGYLVLPVDLVPDFIPVLGYADDAIIVSLVLRSVIRRAGPEPLLEHWPGTPEGLEALAKLCGLSDLGAVTESGPDRTDLASRRQDPGERLGLLRRGVLLEKITLGWNVVGIAVLGVAALTARSVALAGFGLDSLIEIGASTVVLWELSGTGEERQRRALHLVGAAFVALALYLGVQSTIVLVVGYHPHHSPLGIAWAALTAIVMFALAAAKTTTGRALDNPVLQAEGRVTAVDALLATAVLLGLGLNAGVGWWWADPLTGYVILFYGLREGVTALRS